MMQTVQKSETRSAKAERALFSVQLRLRRSRSELLLCALSVLLFGLAAHGKAFFGMLYSHDSLLIVQDAADNAFQISLGRYLQPAYRLLRGNITAPWLIGLMSLLFLTAAVILIVRLFGLRSRAGIILLCGVLTVNLSMTASYATYLPWADVYMLCMLLCTTAVYCFDRYRFGFVIGAVLIAASLALYQAYITVAIGLVMILLFQRLLEGASAKDTIRQGVKALLMLALSGALYYGVLQLVLAASGETLATTYNGIASVGDYTGISRFELLYLTYRRFFGTLIGLRAFSPVVPVLAAGACGALLVLFLVRNILRTRIRGGRLAFLLILTALLPFGLNAICFLSKGLLHSLMTYGCYLFYLFLLVNIEFCLREKDLAPAPNPRANPLRTRRKLAALAAGAACAILLFTCIVFANQVYVKKELQFEATESLMTRMVDRMEQTAGYTCGDTPVVFVGNLSKSSLCVPMPGFETIRTVGTEDRFAVTNSRTYVQFLRYVLGCSIAFADADDAARITADPAVQAMPAFPSPGCCRMIGGYLAVKLSD